MEREGNAELGDEKRENSVSVSKIPPGHYTLESLAKLINGLFSKYNYHQLEAQINTPEAMLQINNFGARPITLDHDLANIFGINRALKQNKRHRYPTTHFIHCDLIFKNYNFFNNKKTDLLAKLDVRGKAYEKVRCDASTQQPIRDCSTSSCVNSVTISVRDQDGKLFDFKEMPLEFELEIN